jgi:hypothetical protein
MIFGGPRDHSLPETWHILKWSNRYTLIFRPLSNFTPTSIVVGNGTPLLVTSTGHTSLSALDHPLHLSHVLVSPDIIKNLIFVRQFTTNNQVFVEFDPYDLSVKDLCTQKIITRCDSTGWLYPPCLPPSHKPTHGLLASTTPSILWHRCLVHLGFDALSRFIPSCNKTELETLCHAYQLNRHVRLPFTTSHSLIPWKSE